MLTNYKYSISDYIIIGCMSFAGLASFLPDEVNSIALYGAIPLAFMITFLKPHIEPVNQSLRVFIWLFAWLLISTLWANYSDIAMRQNKQLLGVMLVSYIVSRNTSNQKLIPWLYGAWVFLYLGALYYANTHIITDIIIGQERLNDEKLNANMMAYFTFYATFTLFVLGDIVRPKTLHILFRILFLSMIVVSFYVAIITASRQIAIIQIPLIGFLLYVRYFKQSSTKVRLLTLLALVVASAVLIVPAQNTYEDSLLQQRNEIEIGDDSRTLLAKDAFQVGMNHFLIGVGNANYVMYSYNKHFSHNTYLELFANVGIIGVSLYLYMLICYFKTQYVRYKSTNDKYFLMFIVFGVIYCLDNIFYVFYPYQWLLAFFILVSSHSDSYYKHMYLHPNQSV